MNFLLILLALLIVGITALSVVALGGERAVPGTAFFSGVGRDGLGTFDRVGDLRFVSSALPRTRRHVRMCTVRRILLPLRPQNLLTLM